MVPTGDGCSLWLSSAGSGPPVLTLHGGPGMWSYLGIFDDCLASNATVFRYDQRGCGRSTGAGPYTVRRFVEDIEVLRRHLGIDRWALAGHSWGASLALAYAWEHPARVERLLYVSGLGLGKEWKAAYREARARRLLPDDNTRLEELGRRARNADEETEFLTLSWARDYANRDQGLAEARSMAQARFPINRECNHVLNAETEAWDEADLMARCSVITAPVLIVHGSEDPRPVWGTDSMLEAIPSVNRVVLHEAGHMPWVEKREDFATIVRDFIAGGAVHG